jgi:STE24 endopeptidase
MANAVAEAGSYEFPYLYAFIAFSTSVTILEQYLEFRQLARNRNPVIPPEVASLVDVEEHKKAQIYQYDKRVFSIFKSLVMFIFQNLGLIFINAYVWHYVAGIIDPNEGWGEYKATLAWLLILHWVDKPLDIPFALYSNFVVEAKHGFNKMTMATFVQDLVKGELLQYFFGALLIPLMIYIIHWGGERFYLYLWAFVQLLIFAFMWIYPNFIQPLFNKFEILKDEELRKKIEDLCAEEKFPLTNLFQIDGSKRSAHSNAYFFGFWKNKRIVLYDTLLHLGHDDILAILCHELGHWKFNHITMNLVISSLNTFTIFWSYGMVMYSHHASAINSSFGYGADNKCVIIGMMNFVSLLSPMQQVLQVLMTMLSRRNEFQADTFANTKGRGEELKSGLLQIHKENKGELDPDPWYSWYHYTHPPLVERLRAMDLIDKKAN